MSVINRMLRDLDRREQRPATASATAAAIAPHPTRWLRVLLLGAVVILAILGLRAVLHEQQESFVQDADTTESTVVAAIESIVEPADEPSAKTSAEPLAMVDEAPSPAMAPQPIPIPLPPQPSAPATAAAEMTQPEPPSTPDLAIASEPTPQQEPAPAASMKVERVELTAAQLAAVNLRRAREALLRGDRDVAQELFEQALILEPLNVVIRSELAAYWYGRGLSSRALLLLEQGLEAMPDEPAWQLMYAKILERVGYVEQAYSALTNIRVGTPEAMELLELRAIAAQRLGFYSEAANDYRELARLAPQGRWWLAAAVAYEDAGEPVAALAAYEQARQQLDLTADARNYINDRIAVLAPLVKEMN